MIRFIINLFSLAKKRCDVTHLIWKAKKKAQKNNLKNTKNNNKSDTRKVLSKTKDLSIFTFPSMNIMAPN